MEQEKRPIPKKTIIMIGVIIIIGIIAYMMNEMGKSAKATSVLYKLGYQNIKNVHVAKIAKFRNEDTNIEGYKYSVKFKNLDNKQECRGFVWADFKNNIIQDLECK